MSSTSPGVWFGCRVDEVLSQENKLTPQRERERERDIYIYPYIALRL